MESVLEFCRPITKSEALGNEMNQLDTINHLLDLLIMEGATDEIINTLLPIQPRDYRSEALSLFDEQFGEILFDRAEEVFKESFKEEEHCRLFLVIGAEARPFRIFTYLAFEVDGFWEDEKLMEDACLLLAYTQLPRNSDGEPVGLS